MVNGLASNTEMDDNSNCDATVVLLKKGNCSSKSPSLLHHSGCSLLAHTVGTAAVYKPRNRKGHVALLELLSHMEGTVC